LRNACEQQRHSRHIAIVFTGLVRTAGDDLLDLSGVDPGAIHGFA